MIPIRLPDEAWQEVEEGTEALLDAWLVEEGVAVSAGQPLAAVVLPSKYAIHGRPMIPLWKQ